MSTTTNSATLTAEATIYPFQIDKLIYENLKKAGVSFIPNEDVKPTLENILELSKNELLTRNEFTILFFVKYCLDHLRDAFTVNLNEVLFSKSPAYIIFSMKTTGYLSGYFSIPEGIITRSDSSELRMKLRSLFTQQEFDQIAASVKEILVGFSAQVVVVRRWIEEHIGAEEKQTDSLVEFLKTLQENEFQHNSKVEEVAKKTLDSVMGSGSHNLWRLEKRKEAGLLSPPEELVMTLDRIFSYLDVLFYSDYMSQCPDDPQEIRFVG